MKSIKKLISKIIKEELYANTLTHEQMKEFLKLTFSDMSVIMPFELPIIKSAFDTYFVNSIEDIDNLGLMELQNLYNNVENKLKTMNVQNFHKAIELKESKECDNAMEESLDYKSYFTEFTKINDWLKDNGFKYITTMQNSSLYEKKDIIINMEHISAKDIKYIAEDYAPSIRIKKNKKLVCECEMKLSNLQKELNKIK